MEKAIAGHFACANHPKRMKNDDEDDWNMTLNGYKPCAKFPWPVGSKTGR